MYRRQEKGGGGVEFPRWREVGEKGKNYATLHNILQLKKCKEAGANKYRAGTGIKGYGKHEFKTPCPPPPKSAPPVHHLCSYRLFNPLSLKSEKHLISPYVH